MENLQKKGQKKQPYFGEIGCPLGISGTLGPSPTHTKKPKKNRFRFLIFAKSSRGSPQQPSSSSHLGKTEVRQRRPCQRCRLYQLPQMCLPSHPANTSLSDSQQALAQWELPLTFVALSRPMAFCTPQGCKRSKDKEKQRVQNPACWGQKPKIR